MKLKLFGIAVLSMLLFYHCDPTKKLYKSEEYLGEVDTTGNQYAYDNYDYEDSSGEYDYEGDYDDYDYSLDTAYSPYSSHVYQSSAKRESDLIHTRLEVRFDWDKAWMYGKATLTVKPYFYPTSTLTLDAKGFEIREVSMVTPSGKVPLKYSYNRDTVPDTMKLVIQLGKEYTRNDQYEVYIDYIAKPNTLPKGGSAAITEDKGLYFINNKGEDKNKPMQIWTQGETEATSCWCPTIDKPNERCTDEILITIDDKYQTLSNGVMVSSKKNTDGTRTDDWKMDQPHAPYLFMMAIGQFSIIKDTWKNIPVNYYVEPAYANDAKAIFGHTPEMIDFFSNRLGVKYAWPKYSQVVVRDYVSGAMENTTATLHGEFLQQKTRELLDESYEDVISHELFHQWFGDLVTCESWSNVPLNESFATYGEYLWREFKYGRDDADQLAMEDLSRYLDEASYKKVDLIRFNYETREDMFDSHSYAKGGRVLHMLRKYLGDDAFFAGLQKYLEDNKYTSVEIHDLRKAMEDVSGEDLNWFFNEWFLNSGHPELSFYYEYNADSAKEYLTVYQLQDTATSPIYVLPIDVDIYANGKVERQRITVDRESQTFTFDCPGKPDLVNVDAEKMLLCTKIDNKTVDEFVFQFYHAPLYLDRYEAVETVSQYQSESPDYLGVVAAALNDKHWSIRQFALDTLLLDANTSQDIKNKIMDMAQHDPKSYVRASAIGRLKDITGIDAWSIYNNALNDSSYAVMSAGLSAIYNNDPKKGLETARSLRNINNDNLEGTVMNIIGNEGDAVDNDYFISKFQTATGFDAYFVMLYYEPFLQRMTDSYVINKGVDELKKIAMDEGGNFWMSFTATSILTGLQATYQNALDAETDPQIQRSLYAAIDYLNKAVEEINSAAGSTEN